MRNKPIPVYFFIALLLNIFSTIFLKSTLIPDVGFIVLIMFSMYIGPFYGALLGFLFGLSLDILSISPLGFHCAIMVAIGYLFGKVKGKIFVDPIIVPIVIVMVSYFVKAFFGFLLLMIVLNTHLRNFFFNDFFRKMILSCIASPFVYFFIRSFRLADLNQKD